MNPHHGTPTPSPPPPGANYPTLGAKPKSVSVRVAVLVILVLAVIAAFTARPAWHAFKRVRAEAFGRQAMEFLAREQWTLAFERTRSALQLNPSAPLALRCAATLYARLQTDTAFRYFDALLTTPAATTIDRENYVDLALRLGNTNIAAVHLGVLLESPRPSPRSLALGALLQNKLGQRGEALRLAEAALALEPANPTNAFTLAAIRSQSRRVTERETARAILWPFARTNGSFRTEALATILAAPDAPRSEREEVLAILRRLPSPTFEERILTLEAEVNLQPDTTRDVAEEAIRTLRPKTEKELRHFVEWLVIHDFLPEALDLMAGDRMFRDRPLYLIRHRALMAGSEPQKGYDLLFHPASPFTAFELECLRCQAAATLGNTRARDTHLATAGSLVNAEIRKAAVVTELAALCGNLTPAIDAWRTLQRIPKSAPLALRQLAILADNQGDTIGARDYTRQILTEEPENPGARIALAHCNLLLGEEVDSAQAEIVSQLAKDPDDIRLRGLAALALLRKGAAREADMALQGVVFRYDSSPGGLLAIFAAVAAANDQWIESLKILDRIPIRILKPEERELLRPVIALESRLVSGIDWH